MRADLQPPTGLAGTLQAMRGWTNCLGGVVTYPHKQAVAGAVDRTTEEVAVVGACNVVRREADGRLTGGMTDGLGFVSALARNGIDPSGFDVRLIGAGGAGSAIALALVDAGIGRLVVHDTDADRVSALLGRLGERRPQARVSDTAPADFAFGLVCNATPIGMNGDTGHPFPLDDLPADCVVTDIVPSPPETPWLVEAKRRGHRIQTGPEMVACQLPALIEHLFPEQAAAGEGAA